MLINNSFLYHNFFIMNNSLYPFLCFINILLMISSLIINMKYMFNSYLLFIMLILFLMIMLWINDIMMESLSGFHNFYVNDNFKMSMFLFIFSEVMFFFSLFWLFFDSSLIPMMDMGAIWVPKGIISINYLSLPLLNTIILLSSAITLTWSQYKLFSNLSSGYYLKLTIMLGFFFLIFQMYEYYMSSFTLNDSIYGSIFYLLTGCHGMHVMMGALFLLFNYFRMEEYHFNLTNYMMFEFAILYWHFVDVVWLMLYIFIYCWFI